MTREAHFSWEMTPRSLLELVAVTLSGRRGRSMSTATVVVDPVTRIEGHLPIEAETDGK